MLALVALGRCLSTVLSELNKDSFFWFTGDDKRNFPVSVVEFYGMPAAQCPECVESAPIFEEIARCYHGEPRIRFARMDCSSKPNEEVCQSSAIYQWPTWAFWVVNGTGSRVYNRNKEADSFERWLRQQTGIWPYARRNNLLYANVSTFEAEKRRHTGCLLALIDHVRGDASQDAHRVLRDVERHIVKGNVLFLAIDAKENKEMGQLLEGEKFSVRLWRRRQQSWTKYDGELARNAIFRFLHENDCRAPEATPTPTPTALPELEPLPEDEFIPADAPDGPSERAAAAGRRRNRTPLDEDV